MAKGQAGRTFFGVVVVIVLLAAGCSYTVRPTPISSAPGGPAISLPGTSILIVNGEKNGEETAVFSEGRGGTGLKANRQEWSRMLTESLAGELARRGAQVRANAKLVLTVTLPRIVFTRERNTQGFTVNVLISSSTGWSKSYDGTARTGEVSSPQAADRIAAQSLADAVRTVLSDPEFQTQLTRK